MARQEANWVEIDPETLNNSQASAYAEYKRLYKTMKAARQSFEDCMSVDVPEGDRMIFGYNFGKLSVAIVPDDRAPKKAKAQAQSLAEYLAGRSARSEAC